MTLCAFTIVARNYLPLALTLADSVRRLHPEADFRIFVVDGLQGLPAVTTHALVDLHAYLDDSFEPLRFKYNITEYCTSVKPHLFQRLLAETDAEHVYYLDPDTWLFDRLEVIHGAAPEASVFLAPHLLECRLRADHVYPEYKHLWEGIFNLGFCAIRRSPAAEHFLAWWDGRLRDGSYADAFDGLHTDQKWMDYAPVYLGADLHIVRHPGVNVAHWNLDERRLEGTPDTGLTVNGQRLVLFHFSGFDFRGTALTRHADVALQARYASASLTALASAYRATVLRNGYEAHITIPYRYASYDNGDPISSLHRRLYRSLGDARFDAQPFRASGPLYRAIQARGLIDRSPAATRSHAAATLPTLGRLTRIAHGVLRTFLRVAGPSRYAYLLKFFNRYARPENHAFLLGDPPPPAP